MKKEIKSISPLRLGVIMGVILALFALIVGVLGLIFGGMVGPSIMGNTEMGGFGMSMGGGIIGIVISLVVSLIAGFIIGVIEAFIYNVVAGVVGGVIIQLEDV